MPFCPNCRDEFQDWVEFCPDCKVALVDELPDLPPKLKIQLDPIMYIGTAPNEPIAYMWAGILEDNGVKCLIKQANLRAAMYSWPINHYCTIHVSKSNALRARRLLLPFEKSHRDYVRSKKTLLPVTSRIFIFVMFLFFYNG
jgi:hypothetical protein